jgi:hypothetical protein
MKVKLEKSETIRSVKELWLDMRQIPSIKEAFAVIKAQEQKKHKTNP